MDTNNVSLLYDRTKTYKDLPLTKLAELIVQESDRAALNEFHDNRKLFRFGDNSAMLFADFVDSLCGSCWALKLVNSNYNLLEKARDHLIDRFCNLPTDQISQGPDCRYYFDGFLEQMHTLCRRKDINPLEKEVLAVKTLQQMAMRHFMYCIKESSRSLNPLRSRYQWHLNGDIIIVWMPLTITGNKRRLWLEEHIDDPDSNRPGEKQRIQQIIDSELGLGSINYMGDFKYTLSVDCGLEESQPSNTEDGTTVCDIAKAVVDEKAKNIHLMRPSVRILGRTTLRKLITRIFEQITEGCYDEKKLAQRFGLSQSSLTRFAGSRWQILANSRPPDLWSNLAHLLSKNGTAFSSIARSCGIWKKVQEVIRISG